MNVTDTLHIIHHVSKTCTGKFSSYSVKS